MSEADKRRPVPEGTDELDREMDMASLLAALDPAAVDRQFWVRFHVRVLKDAAPELARRRLMIQLTVEDVMTSWARTVIPTAVLAAALAGLLLFRGHSAPSPALVGVEELLLAEVEGTTIPGTLAADEVIAPVSFASEGF
jgi:hypothetical protein